jgi:hypothetical protein
MPYTRFALPVLALLVGCQTSQVNVTPVDPDVTADTTEVQTDTQTEPTCSGTVSGTFLIRPSVKAGLKNPCTINGSLTISLDAAADELATVQGLQVVTGDLELQNGATDPGPVLPHLTQVNGSITLQNIGAPLVSGFDALLQADGGVTFMNSTGIQEIRGFASLTATQVVEVNNLPNLELIDGFSSLSSLAHLKLSYLSKLKTVLGLGANVTGQVETVWLSQLQLLQSFPTMDKVTEVAALETTATGFLSVSAWPSLTKVETLTVTDNAAVASLHFPVLTQVETGLFVGSNPYLKSMAGLDAVTSCGQVRFCNNHKDLTEAAVHAWIAVHGGQDMKCN